jgi:hypothetical protein
VLLLLLWAASLPVSEEFKGRVQAAADAAIEGYRDPQLCGILQVYLDATVSQQVQHRQVLLPLIGGLVWRSACGCHLQLRDKRSRSLRRQLASEVLQPLLMAWRFTH